MIVDRKTFNESDGTLGWVECVYDSSNILTSTYFPKSNILYLSFKRGGTYKYSNINEDIYALFENCDSQGKFFVNEIRNKPEYPYMKAFQLNENEIEVAKEKIQEWKTNQQ